MFCVLIDQDYKIVEVHGYKKKKAEISLKALGSLMLSFQHIHKILSTEAYLRIFNKGVEPNVSFLTGIKLYNQNYYTIVSSSIKLETKGISLSS